MTSPPEPAVPPGRLAWSRGEMTTVWTVQAMPVWEALESTGRFELRTGEFTPTGFEDAYAWMRRRLSERNGWDFTRKWPVWGWTRITRRNLVPDWEGELGQVIMRMEVPREFVVSSHFDGWHTVLNNGTLYPPDLPEHDDQAFDAWDEADSTIVAELGGIPGVPVAKWPNAARAYAESTWERIFDVDAWSRRHTMQCVMPFLDAGWVTRAVRIDELEVRRRIYR